MDEHPSQLTTTAADWAQTSLQRLRYLLEQTPEAAPDGLTALEALALLEWGRMAVYADCHEMGVGDAARQLVRGAMRRLAA
jgi:hypothetical protein